MSIWPIVWFIITNAPTIYKFIKEVLDVVDGDKAKARDCVNGLCSQVKAAKAR